MSTLVKNKPTKQKASDATAAPKAASEGAPKSEAELLKRMRTHLEKRKGVYDALGNV